MTIADVASFGNSQRRNKYAEPLAKRVAADESIAAAAVVLRRSAQLRLPTRDTWIVATAPPRVNPRPLRSTTRRNSRAGPVAVALAGPADL